MKKQKALKQTYYFEKSIASLRGWKPGIASGTNAKFQVLDFFSGCGGMSLGFAAVGKATGAYQIVGGVDINRVSLDTYERNFGAPGIVNDIRDLAYKRGQLRRFLESLPTYDPGRETVLIGCAPCQGFSAHRKKNWDQADVRNSLIEAFAETAVKINPACVVMENVPELLSGRYWPHFQAFKLRLERAGYIVKQSIHNAAEYGVPQERFRALVVAMREDFSLPVPRLQANQFSTVRDAIGELEPVVAGQAAKNDPMQRSAKHRAETLELIAAVPKDGGSRPVGLGPRCLQNFKGFADVYGRLYWNRPAITITHYARNPASGRFIHPEQNRGLTMREAARLQSFPDGFDFCGAFDDVFRQIGEAVPPLFAMAVAAATLANLRKEDPLLESPIIDAPVNDSYAGVIAGIKGKRARCA